MIEQKHLHDLDAWNALTVEEQERAVGRRKLSNVELADDEKPSNSHVALTNIVGPDGDERQILRDNMAFGTIGRRELGTYSSGTRRRRARSSRCSATCSSATRPATTTASSPSPPR